MSRETRLLLTAGVLAVAALWLLARFRFPDLPVTPNPVPSVLSQLSSGPTFDDLAAEMAQLQLRLQPSVFALEPPAGLASPSPRRRRTAMRLRDDFAVTLLPDSSSWPAWTGPGLRALDRASGLAVVRLPVESSGPVPAPWTPRRLQQPRYFAASDVSREGVLLRPAFVASLDPIDSPLWADQVWAVAPRSDLAPGSFLFTSNAELVGLVMVLGSELVIVPGATVVAEANRLLDAPPGPPGVLGVNVQALSEELSLVTGARLGVVVSHLDAAGPAAGQLMVGDVIEALDRRLLQTRQHWEVRTARLSEGEPVTLRIRRHGESLEVTLTASAPPTQPSSPSLGLALRVRARVGAEVTRVDRGSAGDRAGLAAGDVITLLADVPAPTPEQVTQAFASMEEGQRVLVAISRGEVHFVTTLGR